MPGRLRVGKEFEKSAVAGALMVTDSNKEAAYLPAGSNSQVLTVVGGTPTWQAPSTGSSFDLSDGTHTQTVNAGQTLLFSAGVGATVLVGATRQVTYAAKISTDANNAIIAGTDNGLFAPIAKVVTGSSWNDATNTLTITFSDGSHVDIPIIDAIGTFLSDFVITDGTTSSTINNHATLTFGVNNKIKATVSANTVTFGIDPAGSTSGDFLRSTGPTTSPTWQTVTIPIAPPVPKKEAFTPSSGATTVTLASTPSVVTGYNSPDVYRNGKLVDNSDWTISGSIITFGLAFGASTGADYSETVIVKYYV